MNWTLAATGFVLGLGAAVPLGPVNIEIIRRSLLERPLAGAAVGSGAVSADLCYLALAFAGVGAAIQASALFSVGLGLAGGLFLAWLGANALRSGLDRAGVARQLDEARHPAPAENAGEEGPLSSGLRRLLAGRFGVGLLMTLLNPYTIAFWITVSANAASGVGANNGPSPAASLFSLALGVAAGAGGWVALLTGCLAAGRRFVGVRFLMAASVLGGLALLGFAGVSCWRALDQLPAAMGGLPAALWGA